MVTTRDAYLCYLSTKMSLSGTAVQIAHMVPQSHSERCNDDTDGTSTLVAELRLCLFNQIRYLRYDGIHVSAGKLVAPSVYVLDLDAELEAKIYFLLS